MSSVMRFLTFLQASRRPRKEFTAFHNGGWERLLELIFFTMLIVLASVYKIVWYSNDEARVIVVFYSGHLMAVNTTAFSPRDSHWFVNAYNISLLVEAYRFRLFPVQLVLIQLQCLATNSEKVCQVRMQNFPASLLGFGAPSLYIFVCRPFPWLPICQLSREQGTVS